jgi:hypothetical protein
VTITKLMLYNGALRLCGDAALATVTDSVESRRLLDAAYDEGAIDAVLEMGLWNFAMKTSAIEYDDSIEPDFGFDRAFAKPSDWIRTQAVSDNEFFTSLLPGDFLRDEAGYWWASGIDTIYVRYISNGASYGSNLALWPRSFARLMQAYLAQEIAPKIREASTRLEIIEKKFKSRLIEARSRDAMNEGASLPPVSSWRMARRGGRGFRDGGSRSRLTG